MFDEESEARQPNVRLFIILLDDYHVRRGNDLAVAQAADRFRAEPARAAGHGRDHVSADAGQRADLHAQPRFADRARSTSSRGARAIYDPRNEFEERYAYYPAQTVENIRNDVTMGALKGAAVRLGGMREGRKSIIFVSEGFTSTLPAQLNEPVAAMPGIGNRAPPGQDRVQQLARRVAEVLRLGRSDQPAARGFDTVNRNNTSIYAVDPRGLSTFEYDINQGVSLTTDRTNLNQSIDTLRVLADNTDGRAIVNRNDLAAGMKQIIRDASGYYLLGYTSTSAPTDGEVPHDRRAGEAAERGGPRAQGILGLHRGRRGARDRAAEAGTAAGDLARAQCHRRARRSGHAARFWTGTDQAPAARRASRSCGSRSPVRGGRARATWRRASC